MTDNRYVTPAQLAQMFASMKDQIVRQALEQTRQALAEKAAPTLHEMVVREFTKRPMFKKEDN
ncbi:MAG TPA: hypothetical protein VH591_08860 [Ktedonobacterales bacterium]